MDKDGTTDAPRAVTPQQQLQEHKREDPPNGTTSSTGSTSPTKFKRRKVNHEQPAFTDRPCVRCVKRNIGHLCHDEPREPAKNAKVQPGRTIEGDDAALKQDSLAGTHLLSTVDQPQAGQRLLQEPDLDLSTTAPTDGQTSSAQLADPVPASEAPGEPSGGKSQPHLGHHDWSYGGQSQFQDMHNFHPSYMFNAPEVTNEYNLLNDFLSTSLLDDGAMFSGEDAQGLYSDPSLINTAAASTNGHRGQRASHNRDRAPRSLGQSQTPAVSAGGIDTSSSAMPSDKARETYYLTAADPAGNDTPEERMEKLLKAKYRAGMLRPFNYVNGYKRLNEYMDKHMQPVSRQKILRELDRFRPKFRERMQSLTDMELVLVEMWFERSLMEYDRVFASMAIPACCWRRTGEIFRGNKEMAELIHVPIEQLRDGKLAVHEIIVEDNLVSYWEKFGTIAFDNSQKAMLTSCSLKNPNLKFNEPGIRCCFSFTIRRDTYDILTRHLAFAVKLEKTLSKGIRELPALADSIRRSIESVENIPTSAVANKSRDLDERGTTIWNLTSKYKEDATLAVALALDLADIWWKQLNEEQSALDAAAREQLADTLFEISRDQARKQLYKSALQWLKRAYDILIAHDQGDLSSDASALKRSIMHCQVYALLKERCEENYSKAWNIIHNLENEAENAVAISLLKLSVLTGDPTAAQEYYNVLVQVVRQIHLSDVNVRTILHHVHALKQRNAALAHNVLVLFVAERLLVMNEIAWVEKTVVTLVWNCTTSTDLGNMTGQLEELLTDVVARSSSVFGASSTHAAQVLIVRHVEVAYGQGDYEQADSWCRLALHSIFSNSGESNIGKLQRFPPHQEEKSLTHPNGRIESECFVRWASQTSRNVGTFATGCQTQLETNPTECLDAIGKAAQKDSTLLYACVLEAQRNGNRHQVIHALSRVHKRSTFGTTPGLHLPTLLRLIARLLVEELDNQQPQDQNCIDELCKVLDGAAAAAKAEVFPMVELDWFARNSYNLALRLCTLWKAESTLQIVRACSAFIDLYPPDTDPEQASDRSLRRLFCHFLGCCLLIFLARAEDRIQEQLQYYSELRSTVTRFRMHLQMQLSRLEGGARTDLLRKHACLVAFDFEAAARLGSWASLGDLIEEAETYQDPKVFNVMADIVLSCGAPTEIAIATLQQIVNKVWQPESEDVDRLARWIRCLLSLALSSNVELAENIVDQVISIAMNAKEVGFNDIGDQHISNARELTPTKQKPSHYPAEELEWIATTTFNRAIDFYCASQDEACRSWAGKAISLAHLGDDHGHLHDLLQNKYMGLAWDH
ncbi:MAG: hypothetical protein Q9193_002951 [Seirophora villosa]